MGPILDESKVIKLINRALPSRLRPRIPLLYKAAIVGLYYASIQGSQAHDHAIAVLGGLKQEFASRV